MSRRSTIACAAMVLLMGLACSESDPVFDNPFDPRNGDDIPVPTAVVAQLGNNLVRLTWQLADGDSASEFAIFRERLDEEGEGERLVARVRSMTYDDTGARNGTPYAYRIAAGRNGRFGSRSERIEARARVVSILIADDAPKTRLRNVTLSGTATAAVSVKVSEDDPSTAQARSLTTPLTWTLSSGDGAKQVHAVFQFEDGSESVPVSDTIELDTRAHIRAIAFDGLATRRPGETIRFTMDAGETGGNASVAASDLFSAVLNLFDDGTNGDTVAGDGVYELDVVLPNRLVANAVVTGRFTDDVGNPAAPLEAARRLTVREPPEAVDLITAEIAEPPDAPAVTLRWTQFQGTDFSTYQLYRSESAPVDSSNKLVGTETSPLVQRFTDTDVVEGRTYHYRVYVVVPGGLMTGSNPLQRSVPNVRPPARVTIESADVGPNNVVLRWSRSPDKDFAMYRVYRNETGAVSDQDVLVAEIRDADVTVWDDRQLEANTLYYYRVFTIDSASLVSRSNERTVTTRENETPEAISLLQPALAEPPAAAGVTLRWTRARESAFSAYRVFRAESEPVDTSDELLGSITAQGTLEFTDSRVAEGKTYFYRVFVAVTSGEQTGSDTRRVDVPNLRAPTAATLQTPDAVSSTRLAVRWNRNPDMDFFRYAVFRNETGAVSDLDLNVVNATHREQTFVDDVNLVENTTYYYRVYTYDVGGLLTRSNEVSATTRNEAPPSVDVSVGTVGTTSATLTWVESAAHDFEFYRLYRSTSLPVTTASTLVVEIDERGVTSHQDTGLTSGTEYSYRIFVVDDGVDPGPKSTGGNTVTLTTN